ncbi:MAG TPA: universal stress protein [Gemmatimonadaceae bacterium]|nr:universal stress protein [Gemmatimonadaceae bacterium]
MSNEKSTPEEGAVATLPEPAARSADESAHDRGPCVVFATNGSAESDAALRFAVSLAERNELALRVLTVLEPMPALPAQPSGAQYHMAVEVERGEQILDRIRPELSRLHEHRRAVTSMLVGAPGPTIAEAASAWNAKYIVLGAGRHSRLERFLAGETVVRVLRHAGVPVIAVPQGCGELPRNGLVALDFGPASIAAAHAAASIIDAGVLHLVHVRPEVDVPATDPSAWSEIYESGARDVMARLGRDLREEHFGIHVERTLAEGHPAEALLAHAEQFGADLIAVGQHSHGTVERLLFGSVAQAIVRAAQCAVLIAPVALDTVQ